MKAPRVTPTGCPSCSTLGLPGTVCAACVRGAHGAHVRATHPTMTRVTGARDLVAATKAHDDARAAWAGAELLLDFFTYEPALWRVGFEVPSPLTGA